MVISILIVDGNARLARVLADLLDDDHRFRVVGIAGTAAEAGALAEPGRAAVALVAQQLPDADGAAACASLRRAMPDCALLLWSHDPAAEQALPAVDGVLERGMTYRELAVAVRDAHRRGPGGRVVDLTAQDRAPSTSNS